MRCIKVLKLFLLFARRYRRQFVNLFHNPKLTPQPHNPKIAKNLHKVINICNATLFIYFGFKFINSSLNLLKMKKYFLVIACVVLGTIAVQAQKMVKLDKSPMDRSYCPTGSAHDRKEGNKQVAAVTYSRPAKNGREVFGKLIPFGEVWRTGANESTEIKFYQDVTIGGKKIAAGTYSLFSIPGEKEWTLILSSDVDVWGAYSYNEKNDVVRVTVPVKKAESVFENLTIEFVREADSNPILQVVWDNVLVEMPIAL